MEFNALGLEFALKCRGGLVIQYHVRGIDSPGGEVLMEVFEDPDELTVCNRFHGMERNYLSVVLL